MQERRTCRNYYKELRNDLPQESVIMKSKAICEQILASDEYKRAEMILGYYPIGNEVNCLNVLEQALKDGKHVALPRTSKENQMDFYEITSLEDVVEGAFHIMEPRDTCNMVELPQNIGLVLVPGVVFDREGNRYGYGKGFYDRYFARFPELTRIALAYSEQLSDETLECLSTDVKMYAIVTEGEFIRI